MINLSLLWMEHDPGIDIFFFFFFESFGNLVKQTTRIIIISLLFMGVESIFFAFTLFHSLKLFLRTL